MNLTEIANPKKNKEVWRLVIDEKPRSAAMNMAIDEAILIAYKRLGTLPTLRLYQWEQPTLSIGYFQSIDKDIDLPALKEKKIDLVRRTTGGRAVLHNRELTYSMVIGEEHPNVPKGVTESYRYLSQGLMKTLEYLSIKVEQAELERENRGMISPACYDAPSWYEILVQGKKIIGSAQVRRQGTILQHGSLPLELDVDILFSVLQFSSETFRERSKKKFLMKAIALNDAKQSNCSINEIQSAIIKGFSNAFLIEFQIDTLSAEEISIAKSLVATKYAKDEWNYKRTM